MEENLNTNNEINKSKNSSTIIIVVLVVLLIGALGFICYDKFINKEKPPVPTPTPTITGTPTPTVTDSVTPANSVVIDETITLKEISIPNYDEEVNIDYLGHNYLIQIKEGNLFINNDQKFDSNKNPISAQAIYVTKNFILFTAVAQDLSVVSYAMDKDGNKINIVDNDYQIRDLKVENGILTAMGHIFCGLEGDCPDKALIIKYENATIIISPKN